MNLAETIRTERQKAGLSQEQLAEQMSVSRQAVTKWESGQSAPSTENLRRLAELFGTTVDRLLGRSPTHPPTLPPSGPPLSPEEICRIYQTVEEKLRREQQNKRRRNLRAALIAGGCYLALYLLGRLIWCSGEGMSVMGMLFLARPTGAHSYLFGWLLHNGLFWYAAALSTGAALFGKHRLAYATTAAFALGLLCGILFGPNPAGAATGNTHYGWAIWGCCYLGGIVGGLAGGWYGRFVRRLLSPKQ